MSKYITPEQYSNLGDARFNYFAEYKKHKTIKQRDYCESCGHFTGWITKEVPVGKPYRYREASGALESSIALMNKAMHDDIERSNIIFNRVMELDK